MSSAMKSEILRGKIVLTRNKRNSAIHGLLLILWTLATSNVVAHGPSSNDNLAPTPSRQRSPKRVNRSHRLAPDDQTQPLAEGSRPVIDPAQRVVVAVSLP